MSAINNVDTPGIRVNLVIPLILLLMIFSLCVDNSFNIISPALVNYFHIDATTVSWQLTLARLIVGIGSIVYAALSDSISIRKLLVAGIILICIGSLLGYFFHNNYIMVVTARVIQSCGLGATETLYLITVAKYLSASEQKKYMGFSTSSFQIATVIGMLTGGFLATFLTWYSLFLLPLLTIVFVPFIWKYMPETSGKKSHVDVIGMILIACVATTILLAFSAFSWWIVLAFIVSCILFYTYISKCKTAFIDNTFFHNKLFVSVLVITLLSYAIEAAYAFNIFGFMLTASYNVNLDKVSVFFIPACLFAALVGSLSGKIGQYFSSKQCIFTSIILMTASVLGSIFLLGLPIEFFAITLVIFLSSFALLYAPLIDTSLQNMPENKLGTALGFYNLFLSIAMSIGFSYSSFFIDRHNFMLGIGATPIIQHYNAVLLTIGILGILAFIVFASIVVPMMRKTKT